MHQARKLEKKGILGKADPYTLLTVGKEKFKSATINNDQNPEWNYTIKFDLTKDIEEEITLEVFDEDIGRDDQLGNAKISLREIVHQKNVNNWIHLNNCKTGEVLFSAEYIANCNSEPINRIEDGEENNLDVVEKIAQAK